MPTPDLIYRIQADTSSLQNSIDTVEQLGDALSYATTQSNAFRDGNVTLNKVLKTNISTAGLSAKEINNIQRELTVVAKANGVFNAATEKAIANLEKFNGTGRQFIALMGQGVTVNKALSNTVSVLDSNIRKLDNEYKATKKTLDVQIQAESANMSILELKSKSLNEQRKILGILREEYNNLTEAERASAKGTELESKIAALGSTMEQHNQSLNNWLRGLGNITSATETLISTVAPARQNIRELEQTLIALDKEGGATSEQIAAIKSQLQNLGTTARSAEDVMTSQRDIVMSLSSTAQEGALNVGKVGRSLRNIVAAGPEVDATTGKLNSQFKQLGINAGRAISAIGEGLRSLSKNPIGLAITGVIALGKAFHDIANEQMRLNSEQQYAFDGANAKLNNQTKIVKSLASMYNDLRISITEWVVSLVRAIDLATTASGAEYDALKAEFAIQDAYYDNALKHIKDLMYWEQEETALRAAASAEREISVEQETTTFLDRIKHQKESILLEQQAADLLLERRTLEYARARTAYIMESNNVDLEREMLKALNAVNEAERARSITVRRNTRELNQLQNKYFDDIEQRRKQNLKIELNALTTYIDAYKTMIDSAKLIDKQYFSNRLDLQQMALNAQLVLMDKQHRLEVQMQREDLKSRQFERKQQLDWVEIDNRNRVNANNKYYNEELKNREIYERKLTNAIQYNEQIRAGAAAQQRNKDAGYVGKARYNASQAERTDVLGIYGFKSKLSGTPMLSPEQTADFDNNVGAIREGETTRNIVKGLENDIRGTINDIRKAAKDQGLQEVIDDFVEFDKVLSMTGVDVAELAQVYEAALTSYLKASKNISQSATEANSRVADMNQRNAEDARQTATTLAAQEELYQANRRKALIEFYASLVDITEDGYRKALKVQQDSLANQRELENISYDEQLNVIKSTNAAFELAYSEAMKAHELNIKSLEKEAKTAKGSAKDVLLKEIENEKEAMRRAADDRTKNMAKLYATEIAAAQQHQKNLLNIELNGIKARFEAERALREQQYQFSIARDFSEANQISAGMSASQSRQESYAREGTQLQRALQPTQQRQQAARSAIEAQTGKPLEYDLTDQSKEAVEYWNRLSQLSAEMKSHVENLLYSHNEELKIAKDMLEIETKIAKEREVQHNLAIQDIEMRGRVAQSQVMSQFRASSGTGGAEAAAGTPTASFGGVVELMATGYGGGANAMSISKANAELEKQKKILEQVGATFGTQSSEFKEQQDKVYEASKNKLAAYMELGQVALDMAGERVEAYFDLLDQAIQRQIEAQNAAHENRMQAMDVEYDYQKQLLQAQADMNADAIRNSVAAKKKQANEELLLQYNYENKKAMAEYENRRILHDYEVQQFENNKKLQYSQAILSAAAGTMMTIATLGVPMGAIAAAAIIPATLAAQLLIIGAQEAPKFTLKPPKPLKVAAAKGRYISGPSHASGGVPIEAEGGEVIINKRSTSRFLPLLSAINEAGGGVPFYSKNMADSISGLLMQYGKLPKFADGGIVSGGTVNAAYQDAEAVMEMQTQSLRAALADLVIVTQVSDVEVGLMQAQIIRNTVLQ